jgi:hypothetical protein
VQLDPFSSFGVRNPRLSAKEPTQEKGQRQKIENSENTGEREKEMMKSPLQEKKKKHRPPLQHMWSVLAPCRETFRREKKKNQE